MTDWNLIFEQRDVPREMLDEIRASGGFRETAAVARLREALDAGKRLVVLSGDVGSGKTSAGLWSCCGDVRSRFVDAAMLQIGGMFSDRLPEYIEVPRLCIDDLGVEFLDERGAFRTTIDALVNQRYQTKRTTIITTNLDSLTFVRRYGERIADRIRGSGSFLALSVASMRGKPLSGKFLPLPCDFDDVPERDGTLSAEVVLGRATEWLKTHRVDDEPTPPDEPRAICVATPSGKRSEG